MKKELKESIIIITTVTFTIIQLIFYIQYTLTANKSTTSQVTNVSEIKDEEVKFTTINDELKVLDNSLTFIPLYCYNIVYNICDEAE